MSRPGSGPFYRYSAEEDPIPGHCARGRTLVCVRQDLLHLEFVARRKHIIILLEKDVALVTRCDVEPDLTAGRRASQLAGYHCAAALTAFSLKKMGVGAFSFENDLNSIFTWTIGPGSIRPRRSLFLAWSDGQPLHHGRDTTYKEATDASGGSASA
jgi:hypothetical protein